MEVLGGGPEVGRGVLTAAEQGPSQCLGLLQGIGDVLLHRDDGPLYQEPSQARALNPVGLDQALVDTPVGLDRGVAFVGLKGLKTPGLGVGKETYAGAQGAPSPVERVALAPVLWCLTRRRHSSSRYPPRYRTRKGTSPPGGPDGTARGSHS